MKLSIEYREKQIELIKIIFGEKTVNVIIIFVLFYIYQPQEN